MDSYRPVLRALFDGWCSPSRSLSSSLSRFSHSPLFDRNLIRIIDEFLVPLEFVPLCQIERQQYHLLLVDGDTAYTINGDYFVNYIEVWRLQSPTAIHVATWIIPGESCVVQGLHRWVNGQLILFFVQFPYGIQAWTISRYGKFISKMDMPPVKVQASGYMTAVNVESNRGYIAWAYEETVMICDANLEAIAQIDVSDKGSTDKFIEKQVSHLVIHPEQDRVVVLQWCRAVSCFDFQGHCLFRWQQSDYKADLSFVQPGLLMIIHASSVSYHREHDGEECEFIGFHQLFSSPHCSHSRGVFQVAHHPFDILYTLGSVPRRARPMRLPNNEVLLK